MFRQLPQSHQDCLRAYIVEWRTQNGGNICHWRVQIGSSISHLPQSFTRRFIDRAELLLWKMVKFRRFRDKTSCSAWAETLWRKRMNFQSILKSDRNTKHVSSFRIWEKQRLHILNNVLGDVSLSPHSMKPPKLPWHFLLCFFFVSNRKRNARNLKISFSGGKQAKQKVLSQNLHLKLQTPPSWIMSTQMWRHSSQIFYSIFGLSDFCTSGRWKATLLHIWSHSFEGHKSLCRSFKKRYYFFAYFLLPKPPTASTRDSLFIFHFAVFFSFFLIFCKRICFILPFFAC